MPKRRKLTPEEEAQAHQDEVTNEVNKLEAGNRFLLRLARFFAFALVVATSVSAVISLGQALIEQLFNGSGTAPNDANLSIILIIVLAMDTGMLLAATMIRIGQLRGKSAWEMRGQFFVLLFVALTEAGTYVYMLWLYEKPHDWLAWTLIIVRGFAVPVLSIYLATAQPITINQEDIDNMIARFAGIAVLRDLVTRAYDPERTSGQRVRIYRASAELTPKQDIRMKRLYLAVMDLPDEDEPTTGYIEAGPGSGTITNDPAPFAVAPVAFEHAEDDPHTDFVMYTSTSAGDGTAPHMAPQTKLRRFPPANPTAAKKATKTPKKTPQKPS